MMDFFAQVLDEAFHGLNSYDSVEALDHFEAIKELVQEFEESLEANEIPEEVRIC